MQLDFSKEIQLLIIFQAEVEYISLQTKLPQTPPDSFLNDWNNLRTLTSLLHLDSTSIFPILSSTTHNEQTNCSWEDTKGKLEASAEQATEEVGSEVWCARRIEVLCLTPFILLKNRWINDEISEETKTLNNAIIGTVVKDIYEMVRSKRHKLTDERIFMFFSKGLTYLAHCLSYAVKNKLISSFNELFVVISSVLWCIEEEFRGLSNLYKCQQQLLILTSSLMRSVGSCLSQISPELFSHISILGLIDQLNRSLLAFSLSFNSDATGSSQPTVLKIELSSKEQGLYSDICTTFCSLCLLLHSRMSRSVGSIPPEVLLKLSILLTNLPVQCNCLSLKLLSSGNSFVSVEMVRKQLKNSASLLVQYLESTESDNSKNSFDNIFGNNSEYSSLWKVFVFKEVGSNIRIQLGNPALFFKINDLFPGDRDLIQKKLISYHIQSLTLWKGCNKGTPFSVESCVSTLLTLSLLIDADGSPIVKKIQKNGFLCPLDEKPNKEMIKNTPLVDLYINVFWVWVLLSQWAFQLKTSSSNNNSDIHAGHSLDMSKFMMFLSDFLSLAVRRYSKLHALLTTKSSDNENQRLTPFASFVLIETTRVVFNLLEIYGRTTDQRKIFQHLIQLKPNIACELKPEYLTLSTDLLTFTSIKLAWCGEVASIIPAPQIDSIYEYLGSGRADPWVVGVKDFAADCAERLSEPDSNAAYLDFEAEITEIDLLCNSVYDSLFSSSLNTQEKARSSPSGEPPSAFIRVWIALLSAKVLFLKYSRVSKAANWVKTALNKISQLSGEARDPDGVQKHLTLESVVPKLEAILLLVELYDHCGDADKCLGYLAEAQVLSAAVDSAALTHVIALHATRIWFRMNSPRLSLLVQDIMQSGSNSTTGSRDDVSKLVRAAASDLAFLFDFSQEDGLEEGSGVKSLEFRHVNKLWNLSRIGLSSDWEELEVMYKERRLRSYNNRIRSGLLTSLCGLCTYLNEKDENLLREVLSESLCSCNFELIRSTKRSLSLNFATDKPFEKSNKPWPSFIAGATSFGSDIDSTAKFYMEQNFKNKDKLKVEKNDFGSLSMGEIGVLLDDLVLKSCEADHDESESWLTKRLQQLLSHVDASSNKTICFLCLDSSDQFLLFGSFDGENHKVFRIPIGEQLVALRSRWLSIQEEGKATLQQTQDAKGVAAWTESQRKHWWDARKQTDEQMGSILTELEELIKPCIHLFGKSLSEGFEAEGGVSELLKDMGELTLKGEKEVIEEEIDIEALDSLKVVELKDLLRDRGLSITGRKADLVARCKEYLEEKAKPESLTLTGESKALPTDITDNSGGDGKGHIILLLDEVLQVLPWESIPCLRQTSCSRVPSLTLLLYALQNLESTHRRAGESSQGEVSLQLPLKDSCWYAIDVDGSLPQTRALLSPFLTSYQDRWGWEGVVGEIPEISIVRSLHEKSSFFIFCGHGAGEKLLSYNSLRQHNSELKKTDKKNERKPLPASLLWGCSSGQLLSRGVYGPSGMSLQYLLGGSPFLVGNLWDVSDKDIDRLCMKCMELAFDSGVSLGAALVKSRETCKLKYAVGAAPVMYGIPLKLDTRMTKK